MVCVLFSRPSHDDILSYLHFYSKELVALSESLSYKTLNKENDDANKSVILNIIKKHKPKLIMLNGHGAPNCICGHDDEIIIDSEHNPDILKESITYSLSCSSAAELGKISVEKGAISFIGYKFDFALGKDPDSEAVPNRDKIAKLFLEPSNLLFSSLLKEKSAITAVEKARKMMLKNIEFLENTDEFLYASDYAPYLFGNYLGLSIQGDENSSIS